MRRYVPRRARRRRRILLSVLAVLAAASALGAFAVIRDPALVPGASELLEQARIAWDLARLPRTLETAVTRAEFWDDDLLVLDMEIRNGSRFVIPCRDLRVVDRSGRVYVPSSTGVYYVNREESLWMREIEPGESIAAEFAFAVPDRALGLSCAVETRIGLVTLAPIKEITRRR